MEQVKKKPSTALMWCMFLGFFMYGLQNYVIGAAWPLMRVEMGVGTEYVGILNMIKLFGSMVGCIVSGWVMGKWATQKVYPIVYFLFAIFTFAVCFTGSGSVGLAFFATLMAITGILSGIVDGGGNSYVSHIYTARIESFFQFSWTFGAFAGPIVIALFIAIASWQGAWALMGVLCIITSLLMMLCSKRKLWVDIRKAAFEGEAAEARNETANKSYVLAVFCLLCCFASEGAGGVITSLLSSFLVDDGGISASIAAAAATIYAVGGAAGRFACGVVVEKLGTKNTTRAGIALAAIGAVMALVFFKTSLWCVLIGTVLVGFGVSPLVPCLNFEAPGRFGSWAQKIIGFNIAACSAGSAVMSAVGAFIVAKFGYFWMFPIVVILVVICIIGNEIVRKGKTVEMNKSTEE